MSDKWRDRKGCFAKDDRVRHRIGNLSFSSCIGNFYDRSVIYLYDLQDKYEKGIMPYKGALTEQPAKIIEAFGVIQAFNNERMEREVKKRKATDGKRKNIP